MMGYTDGHNSCICKTQNGKVLTRTVKKWHTEIFQFAELTQQLPQKTNKKRQMTQTHESGESEMSSENEPSSSNARRSKREKRGVPPPRMGTNLFEQCEMEQFYVDAEMAVKDTENAPRTHA